MNRRAVFLDRDGTLIHERHFLSRPEDLLLIEGAASALRLLKDRGLALVVLSNQSGVARGRFDLETVRLVNAALERQLLESGIELDGIYLCPHHPEGSVDEFTRACDCRKPAPGLATQAAVELDLKLDGSWIVGDKLSDVHMAKRLPLRPILVRTGYGAESERELGENAQVAVVEDIVEAAAYILRKEGAS